ncbi:hypothetical protein CRUP_025082 [Coryphaenoides rupestris]|nr:hypothetical protein CRUP_025082 [Coryphaenoides rupestris]
MSRSLGDYPLKHLNVVIPDPDIMTFDLDKQQPGFMILASDGLWDAFSNEEAVRFVRERLDEPHFGAKSLVLQSFYRGCPDNITGEAQGGGQVLMLGLDGAGKTTLLYKLKYSERVVTVPTVGFNVEMLETRGQGPKLTVWDVGGQRGMRPQWRHHYADTGVLVFVVDSGDGQRLDEAREGAPSANKQDLPGALSPAQLSLRLDLRTVWGDRFWCVQPCSATSGMGLEEGFRRVAYLLKQKLVLPPAFPACTAATPAQNTPLAKRLEKKKTGN